MKQLLLSFLAIATALTFSSCETMDERDHDDDDDDDHRHRHGNVTTTTTEETTLTRPYARQYSSPYSGTVQTQTTRTY